MSQENMETVRRAVGAFNRHDLNALAELCHAEFEFISVLAAVDAEGATYRGKEAWTSYFAQMVEIWEEWRVEDRQLFDADGDYVVAVFRLVGQGRHSGVPVERKLGITYQIREGKLWRMRSYLDPSETLEAVGLRE